MIKFLSIVCLIGLILNVKLSAQTFQLNSAHNIAASGRGDFVSADIDNDNLIDVIFCGINDIGSRMSAVYRNNGDDTFTNLGVNLLQVSDGAVAIGDLNNDGLLDIFITGTNISGVPEAQLSINLGSGSFTNSTFDFEGLAFGNAEISDINNDGRTDLITTGVNASGMIKTLVYRNDGNDQFVSISHDIDGVNNGSLLLNDFNRDGYVDIIVSGLNNTNERVTDLYLNNKGEIFEQIEAGLPAVRSGAMAAGDYNDDGFADLFISGNKTGGTVISEVYLNNNGSGFVLDASLPPLEQSAASWGDYDHDGDLDIAISGFENPDFQTYLYENNGSGFVDSNIPFPGLVDGNISWLDYNNDNKQDLIINGFSTLGVITNVYENVLASANTNPNTPTSLRADTSSDSVTLQWDAPTDGETSSMGLSYSVYLGSASEITDIVSPQSDIVSGFRRVVTDEIVRNEITINSLPEGIYYWSVQAIDNNFKGSAFAAEQDFTICYPVSIGQDTSLCVGQNLRLELGTTSDVVTWTSKNRGLVASNSNIIDFTVIEDDSIFVELTNTLGCVLRDTLEINALPLPVIDLGEDREECSGSTITLDAGTNYSEILWNSKKGLLGTDQIVPYLIDRDDTITVLVKDLNMCINSDTLNITELPLPMVDLGADQRVCLGREITFEVQADSVNWRSFSGVELLNSATFNLTVSDQDTLIAQVFDLTTGCRNMDTLNIDFFSLPPADAGLDQVTCPGAAIEIGGDYSDITGLTFSWNPSTTLNDAETSNPLATPSSETTYYVTVIDGNNCENIDSVTVVMDSPSSINAGDNKSICIGASTELGGTPTALGSQLDYTFNWAPLASLNDASVANPVATPDETTIYTLITSTLNCVLDTSFITVTVNPLPNVSVEPEVATIGFGEQLNLVATGGVEYSWSPINALDNPSIASPNASPLETTIYTVEVTDVNGCVSVAEATVIVKNQLFIPELFTPNDDFNNDTFKVYGEGIETLNLSIYDRNSNLVFESSSLAEIMNVGWDGKKEGVVQESGSYVWVIEGAFFDGSPVLYQGESSGIFKLIR